MAWKIGEIVKRTGLSARALHFYESQKLIGPVARNDAGHRVYSQSDLKRLQQIRSLRFLGIPISEMRGMLGNDDYRLSELLNRQLQRVRAQREALMSLERRIETLLPILSAEPDFPDDLDNNLFRILEEMTMYEKYFSQSDIDEMHHHHERQNDSDQSLAEAWSQWVSALKAEADAGSDPKSKKVQNLMRHWDEMLDHLAAGNANKRDKLNDLLHNEPQARIDHGIDDALFEFMAKASGGH